MPSFLTLRTNVFKHTHCNYLSQVWNILLRTDFFHGLYVEKLEEKRERLHSETIEKRNIISAWSFVSQKLFDRNIQKEGVSGTVLLSQ